MSERIAPDVEATTVEPTWRNAPSRILSWVRRDFRWILLIAPILSSTAVYFLSDANVLGWQKQSVCKDLMEIIHPVILASLVLVSLQSWRLTRDGAFGFMAVLSAVLLGREIMGQGAGLVLYPALTILLIYGYRRSERIASLLRSRWALSLLVMCFICYAGSQILDRGLVKRIGWLILWDRSWKPPYASNLEEALETMGGLLLLCSAFAVRVAAGKGRPPPA